MRTEIVIPSSGIVELYDDVAISLNYNIADVRKPDSKNADYSKTITVPGTDNNNQLLAHIFEIGTERLFNPNKKTYCEIVYDTTSVLKGIMRLARINTLSDNRIEYELEIKGRIDDLFTAIKDNFLTDIDWDDLNHTWDQPTIIGSWSAPIGVGYVYPFIDYGFPVAPNTMEVRCFRPATYVKEIVDRIFAFAGFQYSSNFFSSEFFSSLIIPFNAERFLRTQSEITNSSFRASRSATQAITFSAYAVTNWTQIVTATIIYNDDSTSPNSDAGANYSTVTGKYTVPSNGIYTFTANDSFLWEMSHSTLNPDSYFVHFYTKLVKNGTTILNTTNTLNFTFTGNYDTDNCYMTWTGVLNAGDTVEVQYVAEIQQYLSSPFPDTQNNYVKTDSYFYCTLDATLIEGDTIEYSTAIAVNVKMEDFLKSLNQMFNLYWEYDKDTPNKIHIEPRNDYYNSTLVDWSSKLDEGQNVLIEPMAALDSKRYIFKYRTDKDWLNEKYQSTYQQIKDETYGTKIKTVDNDFLKNDLTIEPIFSPTPLYSDGASDRYYPKIVKIDQNNLVSQANANLRILYYGGEKSCNTWTFYSTGTNLPLLQTSYPYCGHIDDPVSPTLDLSWGVPKEVYYVPSWGATYSNNNLYNAYWRQFIEEITHKDSSIVTGWFRLNPADIAMLDFRHLFRFNFQNYRLNKIYDYNPTQESLTRCEFIKTQTTVPFDYITKPLDGGRDNFFTDDGNYPMPALTPGIYLPSGTKERAESFGTGNVIIGNGNFTDPSSTNIFINGKSNIVGSGGDNISIINSSGITVLGGIKNATIINSSGITVDESNAVYISGVKITNCCPSGIYEAQITQNGTPGNVPIADLFSNNTLLITWTYLGVGQYRGTFSSAPTGKVNFQVTGNTAGDGLFFFVDTNGMPTYFDLVQYDILVNNIDNMNCYLKIEVKN